MLPEPWVAKIFERMAGLYGSRLADLWQSSDIDTVRRLWGQKLSGFESMPGAIKEALDALDSKPYPPNLPEFLALCRQAALRQEKPALERLEYTPTPEEQKRAEEVKRKISAAVNKEPWKDPRKWVRDLEARKAAGEVLLCVQEQFLQEAKKAELCN